MKNNLVKVLGIAVVLLICSLGAFKYTNTKDLSCDCKEQSFDAWTNEFIANMKAGQLPHVADKLAESKSTSIYARCINNEVKNISAN